jgi:hypothetical protein
MNRGDPPGSPATAAAPPPSRLQLIDLAAMVIGYGLAGVLFRAFWPHSRVSPHLVAFATGFYLWLGMAMSGPLLLLRRQAGLSIASPPDASRPAPGTGQRTWAEKAWLAIGVYWIVLGALVLPSRLQAFRFGDTLLFGAVPLVASLAFRMFGTRRTDSPPTPATWTHGAGIALVVSWPFAWFCLIVVGQAIL